MARPASTLEGIPHAVETTFARIAYVQNKVAPGKDLDSSLHDSAIREFDNYLVTMSLRAAGPALADLARQAAGQGATSEEHALQMPGGTRIFAVDEIGDAVFGLAIIGENERFAVFGRPGKRGQDTLVSRWQAETPASLLVELESMPDNATDVPAIDLVRMAGRLSAYAQPGGDTQLSTIASEVRASGSLPYSAKVAQLEAIPVPGEHGEVTDDVALAGRCSDQAAWSRFANLVRPLVSSALAGVSEFKERTAAMSSEGRYALEVDGGFHGPGCSLASDLLREGSWTRQLSDAAGRFAVLGQDVMRSGYVWGGRLLCYADLDRRTFAVSSPDGRVTGRWHRNSDLASHLEAHMVVTRHASDGALSRVEIYPVYAPAGAIQVDEDTTLDTLMQQSRYAHIYADEDASPPRLTRRMLAERIARGEPLPQPAGGLDCTTGKLLPGTARDFESVITYAFLGYREDRFAMDRIAQGKKPGVLVVETDFSEEGEDREAELSQSLTL